MRCRLLCSKRGRSRRKGRHPLAGGGGARRTKQGGPCCAAMRGCDAGRVCGARTRRRAGAWSSRRPFSTESAGRMGPSPVRWPLLVRRLAGLGAGTGAASGRGPGRARLGADGLQRMGCWALLGCNSTSSPALCSGGRYDQIACAQCRGRCLSQTRSAPVNPHSPCAVPALRCSVHISISESEEMTRCDIHAPYISRCIVASVEHLAACYGDVTIANMFSWVLVIPAQISAQYRRLQLLAHGQDANTAPLHCISLTKCRNAQAITDYSDV